MGIHEKCYAKSNQVVQSNGAFKWRSVHIVNNFYDHFHQQGMHDAMTTLTYLL